MERGWGDGSVVESTFCSCRGPWFCSQHPRGNLTTVCNYSSREFNALRGYQTRMCYMYIHTGQSTHTCYNINKSKNFKTTPPEKVKSKAKQQQKSAICAGRGGACLQSPGTGKAEEGGGFYGNHPSLNSKFQVSQSYIVKACPKPKPKPKATVKPHAYLCGEHDMRTTVRGKLHTIPCVS